MRSIRMRRAAMAAVSTIVIVVFAVAAVSAGGIAWSHVVLAAAGFTFGYIVVRLTEELFVADAIARRTAQRRLIFAAAVPAIVLTPAALEASPRDYWPAILAASAVWLAISMSYTSFLLGRATRETTAVRPRSHRSRRRRRQLVGRTGHAVGSHHV